MNQIYDTARERQLKGTFDWASLPLAVFAFTGDPETAFNPAHLTIADVGISFAVSQPLVNQIVAAGGYARSSAANFPVIAANASNITFFVLAEVVSPVTASKVIVYLDEVDGVPFAPNGLGYLLKPDWLSSQGWFRA